MAGTASPANTPLVIIDFSLGAIGVSEPIAGLMTRAFDSVVAYAKAFSSRLFNRYRYNSCLIFC